MIQSFDKIRKIGVIGHLVTDEIIMPNKKPVIALGGISYNLASLGSVSNDGVIYPVCIIGDDAKSMYDNQFGSKKFINSDYVIFTSEPNVVNRLIYDNNGEREEWNSKIPKRINIANINDSLDAALFNFISGDDVELQEFNKFKEQFQGPVYLDFHSLALGRDSDGKRFIRKNENWRKYISNVNFLQMNHHELSTITGRITNDVKTICGQISMLHECGPKIVIITIGSDGVIISDSSVTKKYHVPSITINNSKDPTGCGDTYASVFFHEFLLTGDVTKSALKANLYAGAKATFSGLGGYDKIHEIARYLKSTSDKLEIIDA